MRQFNFLFNFLCLFPLVASHYHKLLVSLLFTLNNFYLFLFCNYNLETTITTNLHFLDLSSFPKRQQGCTSIEGAVHNLQTL